jgi:hypothetical protein
MRSLRRYVMQRWLVIQDNKVYILGRRVHHLELGLLLILVGWILVVHDWLLERKKIEGNAIKKVGSLS